MLNHPCSIIMFSVFFILSVFSLDTSAIPLFRVEKNGRISYLLGTNHNIAGSKLPLSVINLIKNSKTVIVESLLSEQEIVERGKKYKKDNFAPSVDWKAELSTIEWLKLKRLFADFDDKFAAEDFRNEKFDFAYLSLRKALENRDQNLVKIVYKKFLEKIPFLSLNPQTAMQTFDEHFLPIEVPCVDDEVKRIAQDNHLNLLGLDTKDLNETLRLVFTHHTFKKFLKNALRKTEDAALKEINNVFTNHPAVLHWFMREPNDYYLKWTPEEAAYSYTGKDSVQDPFMIFIANRHKEWTPTLIENFEKGSVFVAVGKDHITDGIGEKYTPQALTLIEDLSQNGFSVTFAGHLNTLNASCDVVLNP